MMQIGVILVMLGCCLVCVVVYTARKERSRYIKKVEGVFLLRNQQLNEVFEHFFELAELHNLEEQSLNWLHEQKCKCDDIMNQLNDIAYCKGIEKLENWYGRREILMATLYDVVFEMLAHRHLSEMGVILAEMDICIQKISDKKNYFYGHAHGINLDWLMDIDNMETRNICQKLINAIEKKKVRLKS